MTTSWVADDPARTPDGRFAEMAHPDPGQLQLPAEINAWTLDGTFEYPPMPSNAVECVNFWATVDVPDAVLESTRLAYARRRFVEIEKDSVNWRADHPQPRAPEGSRIHREWVDSYQQHLDAKYAGDLDRRFPPDIPRVWIRGIVRAAKMDYSARELPADEAAQVRNLVVNLPGNRRFTVQQIVERYRTRGLVEYMVDKERQDATAAAIERDMEWR